MLSRRKIKRKFFFFSSGLLCISYIMYPLEFTALDRTGGKGGICVHTHMHTHPPRKLQFLHEFQFLNFRIGFSEFEQSGIDGLHFITTICDASAQHSNVGMGWDGMMARTETNSTNRRKVDVISMDEWTNKRG